MASFLLARRICLLSGPNSSRGVLQPSKYGKSYLTTLSHTSRPNTGLRWTIRKNSSVHKTCSLCLKKIHDKGFGLALVSPLAYFRKRKEHEPTHEDQALAQIPIEVFKRDILVKKKKKRHIIIDMLIRLWIQFRMLWRFVRLSLTFGPLLGMYPLAHLNKNFRSYWWLWLKAACEWSGPTFIKLGQWAGTRRDLFPQEFCDLFSQLHTKVKPHSWYTTRRKLRKAFGKNWTKIFVAVDRKPVGSGCIAQVHKGYIRSDMIPDESVIEEALEEDEPASDIDFSEGIEIMGFGHVIDSALGTGHDHDHPEYEASWRWWRQEGVPLPSSNPPKSIFSKNEPGLVSEEKPSELEQSIPNNTSDEKGASKNGTGSEDEDIQLVPVAIKVLHPGVFRSALRDIAILRILAKFAELLVPSLRWLSLPECIEEFSGLMSKQVDLRYEAHALDKFVNNFAENPNIRFPRPVRPYCKRDVLVETFEDGELISRFVNDDHTPTGLKELLASYGLDALLQMVFVDNLVHGDLHPGNILVQNAHCFVPQEENKLVLVDVCDTVVVNVMPAETPIRLVMLDVGISTSLSEKDLSNFRDVFAAVVLGDGERVAELMLVHSSYNKCGDVEAFKHDLGKVVHDARKNTIKLGKIDVGDLFSKVFSVLSHHKVKLESSFASVMLAIFVLEGLGRSLDPEMDILERAKPILLS